ncbi:MAG: hypothetical protein RI932_1968 [Pseudomonadota bacterium]|jgi:hypothetical protein
MVGLRLKRFFVQRKGEAVYLKIQVYQGPALQCEFDAPLKQSCRVRLGKSAGLELPLPYSAFPTDLTLFAIDRWGAKVYLDPRIDGFVSDGQRFGEVRDFIAPRGALKELATVLEPLEVAIPLGSRGALEIGGYTVVFRVERERPKPKAVKMIGAPKAPFALPEANSALERFGFVLGMAMTVMITIPLVQWLNKSKIHEFKSLADMSPFLAAEIVHPDHFQILPWVFGSEYESQKIVSHALHWVGELRRKWNSEDSGIRYEAAIPQLRGFSNPENVLARRKAWQSALETEWSGVAQRRDSAAPGTFLKGQAAYAPFRVVVSGGEQGSLSERVRARIEKLNRTHGAIVSLIETEHQYLKDHFATMNAEIPQIFDAPKEPGLFFRLAEKSFSIERDNFHSAESFASLARQKQAKMNDVQGADASEAIVWSDESLTLPHVLNINPAGTLAGSEQDLLRNAKLSLGSIAPPPAPRPVPKINMKDVETFIRGRSPEVKSCYDVALGKNPRLGGAVVWQWTIAENGRVVRSSVKSSSIKDGDFLKCLEKKVRGWTFPRPVNGAITISFPFRFVVRENTDTLERIAR